MAVKFAAGSTMTGCRNVTRKTRNATPTLVLPALRGIVAPRAFTGWRKNLPGFGVSRRRRSDTARVGLVGQILSGISGADLPLFQPAGLYDEEKSLRIMLNTVPA